MLFWCPVLNGLFVTLKCTGSGTQCRLTKGHRERDLFQGEGIQTCGLFQPLAVLIETKMANH